MLIPVAYLSITYRDRHNNLPFWADFDNADFFTVNEVVQRRYVLYASLICIPTFLSGGLLEIEWYLKNLFIKHRGLRAYLNSLCSSIDVILYVVLVIFNIVCVVVRYRKFMTVLYTIMCIRRHLMNIISQVDIYCSGNRRLERRGGLKIRLYPQRSRRSHPLENTFEIIEHNYSEKRANSLSVLSSNQRIAKTTHTRKSVIGQFDVVNSPIEASDSDTKIEGPKLKVTISNLHEFEKHLTRLSLFIKQVDVDCSWTVFFTIYYHFTVLFHTVFLYNQFQLDIVQHLIFIPYNTFGLLPPLSILILGSLMEREARSLMAKLEYLYLQEDTQCFMYRQMSGMKYPLWSIFKLLDSIEFNCDHLMPINLSTLVDISIFLGASALVIIQYG